jgi:hypothetical protein
MRRRCYRQGLALPDFSLDSYAEDSTYVNNPVRKMDIMVDTPSRVDFTLTAHQRKIKPHPLALAAHLAGSLPLSWLATL